jgi:hypothetical protein
MELNDLSSSLCQTKENCKNFVAYSMVMEENTDIHDIAHLAVYIQGVN